ncbi:MAG: enoyl-CoA hydratase [bacterium]
MEESAPAGGQLLVEKEGPIGWLIFNRPERHNAVTYEMWEAIPQVLAGMAADDDVRIVVLKGAGGRSFVSGADISQFAEKRSSEDAVRIYNAATDLANRTLTTFAKPTIAMIDGYCIGGGCAIAIACDLRIASPKSTFGIPAAKLGLGYAYANVRKLVDLVGPSFAKEIFFTARQFSAAEALGMGLINRVAEEGGLQAQVEETAHTIGANAPLTIRAVKASVAEALRDPDDRDVERVERMVADCFTSEDYQEGRKAFMEKRPPEFRGR